MTEKKTPAEWVEITGIEIMDPDGWDRKNFEEDWAIPLTLEEFRHKAAQSTIMLVCENARRLFDGN